MAHQKAKLTPCPSTITTSEGKAAWRDVVENFDLEKHALVVLRHACEGIEQYRIYQRQVKADGPTTIDRYGTIKAHPLIGLMNQTSARVTRQFAALGIDYVELHDGKGRPAGK